MNFPASATLIGYLSEIRSKMIEFNTIMRTSRKRINDAMLGEDDIITRCLIHPKVGNKARHYSTLLRMIQSYQNERKATDRWTLDILKNRQLPFEHCLTGIDSVTLVIRSDLLDPCREALFEEFRKELAPDYLGLSEHLAMIAVIGEKDTESSDANVRVLFALTQAGIPISTINQGAGKLNLLIGVPENRYEEAISAIYTAIE